MSWVSRAPCGAVPEPFRGYLGRLLGSLRSLLDCLWLSWGPLGPSWAGDGGLRDLLGAPQRAAGHGGGKTDEPDALALPKYQALKRNLSRDGPALQERVGDLIRVTSKHLSTPANKHKGFFCFRACASTGGKGGKPSVVLVATTTNLLQRFASTGPQGICAADGGFKHCIMGWPLTVHGTINPAGNIAETALILTSDMQGATMTQAMAGFKAAAQTATGHEITKGFAMADAAANYPSGLRPTPPP